MELENCIINQIYKYHLRFPKNDGIYSYHLYEETIKDFYKTEYSNLIFLEKFESTISRLLTDELIVKIVKSQARYYRLSNRKLRERKLNDILS